MRTFGLIGYPLEHSFSPKYYAEKFHRENIQDARFLTFPLTHVSEFRHLTETHNDICGLAVTIPYKQAVIPLLDEVEKEAMEVGAVNCIQFKKGKTKGFNTDWQGFFHSLRPMLLPHHRHALVLGTGGASKAVQYALDRLGISFCRVSRNPGKDELAYSQLGELILQKYLLIINCTPVGMYPNVNEVPEIPYTLLSNRHFCYDLIYRPAKTGFLKLAAANGALTKNGMEMLEMQAELNWKIWNED